MLREWRHLRLLKRGGRAHDATGTEGTAPGELAVLCPACPHPNINLPVDWKSVAKESEFVFILVLSPFGSGVDVHSGISTTRVLASMHVSVSNDDKYPATKGILSWALDSHMLFRGNHTINTFLTIPLKAM